MVSRNERRRRAIQAERDTQERGRSRSRSRSNNRNGSRSRSQAGRSQQEDPRIAELQRTVKTLQRAISEYGKNAGSGSSSGVHSGWGLPHSHSRNLVAPDVVLPTGLSGGLSFVGVSQSVELVSNWYGCSTQTGKFKWYNTHMNRFESQLLSTHYVSAVWVERDCLGLGGDVRGKFYLLVSATSETHAKENASAISFTWQEMPSKFHIEGIPRHWSQVEDFGFIIEHVILKAPEESKDQDVARVRAGFLYSPL